MSYSSFPTDPSKALVADASVVINLNATERASEILAALPNPVMITKNAHDELRNGTPKGHGDADALQALIDGGHVQMATLASEGVTTYEELIEGAAAVTLDDGEAATIGHACQIGGAALIDERKARRLCAQFFPSLPVLATADLLMHQVVATQLGGIGQVEAIVRALQKARMRVPPERLGDIVDLIGKEYASACPSLPRAVRLRA